jgi:metal-responsive CopG/Arc/MetJ family transcriptional regulator
VQLTEELVTMLDQLAASTGQSRSHLIREALWRYLDDELRVRTDTQMVDGYVQAPETDDEVTVAELALRESIAEEPW